MYTPSIDWNPQQELLRGIIKKPEHFDEALSLCGSLHAFVHESAVSGSLSGHPAPTLMDELLEALSPEAYLFTESGRDATILWHLWHITRIEDITMNILVADRKQVLDRRWLKRLGTAVTDTGNAMNREEIAALSAEMDKPAFLEYRRAVGAGSREILGTLTAADMKRKFPAERAERIMAEGGLTEAEGSAWLKDFWGRKTVAGILLLPLTRHQAGHLNSCLRLKAKNGRKAGNRQ